MSYNLRQSSVRCFSHSISFHLIITYTQNECVYVPRRQRQRRRRRRRAEKYNAPFPRIRTSHYTMSHRTMRNCNMKTKHKFNSLTRTSVSLFFFLFLSLCLSGSLSLSLCLFGSFSGSPAFRSVKYSRVQRVAPCFRFGSRLHFSFHHFIRRRLPFLICSSSLAIVADNS